MRNIHFASAGSMTMAFLIAFGVACAAAPPTTSEPRPAREVPVDSGFQAFLANVDAAQLELQNGKPEAFKALWSHADDITLSGGFGGTIEKDGSRSAVGLIGSVRSSPTAPIPSSGSWRVRTAISAMWSRLSRSVSTFQGR